MGKKRKASRSVAAHSGPPEPNEADARLGPINSYKDVANAEDEYWMEQDRIMFDEDDGGGSRSKRARREAEEALFEESEEEVFGMDGDEDEEDGMDDADLAMLEEAQAKAAKAKAKKSRRKGGDEEDEEDADLEPGARDPSWWGASRKEYYNADAITTEAEALEEEAEARRIQQKRLARLEERDFGFDADEWLAPTASSKEANADGEAGHGDDDGEGVVTESLGPQANSLAIPDDMPVAEQMRILRARYPELEPLAAELASLHPLLQTLRAEAESGGHKLAEHVRREDDPAQALRVAKYRILGCYVAVLAIYFAILTSPARDGGEAVALDPAELRNHEIMAKLVECRAEWKRVKDLRVKEKPKTAEMANGHGGGQEPDATANGDAVQVAAKTKKASKKADKEARKKARAVEKSIDELSALVEEANRSVEKRKAAAAAARKHAVDSDDAAAYSDFGEEEVLDSKTAAVKAAHKKTLRFYAAEVTQKASRRAEAARKAGGDEDIPYRERFRDRALRLEAEAKRKREKLSQDKRTDLPGPDDASDDEDDGRRDDSDSDDTKEKLSYYNSLVDAARRKKEEKAARKAALAAVEGRRHHVVQKEELSADGKRKITYEIEKNKGLAPRRKKEVRNPRVKKRLRYEKSQKKLRSMRAMYKGGEPLGGYTGERTGISAGLVRARKL